MAKIFIIDFDSTFVTVEIMEELARLSLSGRPERENIIEKIEEITRLGMEGKLAFDKSLRKRLALLRAKSEHVEKLKKEIRGKVSASFERNKDFFRKNSGSIYIISGGFKEIIEPVARDFGIGRENIFANTFCFDEFGNATGVDEDNFLSQKNGKVKQIKALDLSGEIYITGDGFTDYQIKEAGLADKFVAFCENVKRPGIAEKADYTVFSWEEFMEKILK